MIKKNKNNIFYILNMNFYFSILLYLLNLVLINSKYDETINLTLKINEDNLFPLLPITVGGLETEIMFISTYQNISTNIVIFLKQYNISKAKNENKNDSYIFNDSLIMGKVYSDSFKINNNTNIMKFIYNNTLSGNMTTGLIHLFPNKLLILFEKNISYYTISFSEFNINNNLNIILGEKYNISSFKSFDICDMKKKDNDILVGCILKNLTINNKNFSNNPFIVFDYSSIQYRNFIECNTSMILNIKNFLEENGFNCENNKCESESKDIIGYLNFGYRNMKFEKLFFKEKNIDYIIFHGNVINNLKIIYDFHNEKIVLYSNEPIIIPNSIKIPDPWNRKSFQYVFVFGIILLVIILIAFIMLLLLNKNKDDSNNLYQSATMSQMLL